MSPRNARATSLPGGRLSSVGVSVYLREETDECGTGNKVEANTAVADDAAFAVAAAAVVVVVVVVFVLSSPL